MTERDKLITQNLGYVITLARQYKSDILSTDDLRTAFGNVVFNV